MKRILFRCVMILCLTLTAGLSRAEVIACVCVGAPQIDGCGNGGATGRKGQSVIVTYSTLGNYLKDPEAYKLFIESGKAFDKNITGWSCKRY